VPITQPGDQADPGQVPGDTQARGSQMSMFDNLGEQATNLAKEHSDVVKDAAAQAAEKVGDAVDGATGGKFSDQVDNVQGQAADQVGQFLDNE
jgi:MT0933-like antitoxin protein